MAIGQYCGTLAKDYPFFHTRLSKTIAKTSLRLPSMGTRSPPFDRPTILHRFFWQAMYALQGEEVDILAVPPCADESTTRANAKIVSSAGVQAPDGTYILQCSVSDFRIRLKDRIIHPNTAAYWPQGLAVDRITRAQLLELQQERLHKLFRHAIRHVPFYRQWAQQAGHTSDHPPPLSLWPIATKTCFVPNRMRSNPKLSLEMRCRCKKPAAAAASRSSSAFIVRLLITVMLAFGERLAGMACGLVTVASISGGAATYSIPAPRKFRKPDFARTFATG